MKNIITKQDQARWVKLPTTTLANFFNVGYSPDTNKYEYVFNKTIYIKDFENIPNELVSYYTIVEGDSWPGISFKLYGTIDLWWVILKTNQLTDATSTPSVGTELKILDKRVVERILQQIRNAK
ncbi:MAG TPA: hypothetical protein PLA71_00610 [Saccharofermentans sp.]|nr:hypothetical protein [Saccharofermentans sp.]